ncbi:MAG: hypothetical protein D6797_03840, partial [Bdellovibrio sp.]
MKFLGGVFLFIFLASCQSKSNLEIKQITSFYSTPTKAIPVEQYPFFKDDIHFKHLKTAIFRQLVRYERKNLNGFISLGGKPYPLSQVKETLESFLRLVIQTEKCFQKYEKKTCWNAFNEELRQNYVVYAPKLEVGDPRFGEEEETFFTGYYTPLLEGSIKPSKEYPYAIYKRPLDENLRKKTRQEIDFHRAFQGKNLELFFSKDLFELYLLHVEGGGKVRVREGKTFKDYYLSYDGTNSQPWVFISKYMRAKGLIKNGSIWAQREYLKKHPERAEEIFSTCPSYVYFKITDHPPLGSDGVPLTNRRSLATDSKLYPFKGMLTFVQTRRLRESYKGRLEDPNQVPYKEFS